MQIYAMQPNFRALMMRVTGGQDFILEVNKHLWKIISLNHISSIRSYIELVIIKFSMMFPQISIEDPLFVKTLLDINVKQTVASSYLIIAGFVMLKLSQGSSNVI
jgi:hypothetical protein